MDGSRGHDGVRRGYDAMAGKYADAYSGELAGKPLDRALLACLIEQAGPGAPIADVGCGRGHIAAGSLAAAGLSSGLTCPRA